MKEHPNPCNGCKHEGRWDCVSRTGTQIKEECFEPKDKQMKEERTKPDDGDFYGWEDFERLADANGYGTHFDDWSAWWECWKTGYSLALEVNAS